MSKRDRKRFKRKASRIRKLSVSWYMTDQAYGGPEEGGWWFNYGYPTIPPHIPSYHAKTRWFRTSRQAHAYQRKMEDLYGDTINEGRYPVSSVLSDGEYNIFVDFGPPQAYPKVRPHYE